MPLLAALALAGLPFYTETQHLDLNEDAQRIGDLPGKHTFEERTRLWPQPDHPVVIELPQQNRANRPFRELLVSWNVDAPPETGFVVELSVRRDGRNAWSPWMHVGQWGSVPEEERIRACDGGRIDVDFFRGESAFDGAHVRVRAYARKAGQELRIRRMTLCYSDRERQVKARPAPEPRPLGQPLSVPPRSQKLEEPEIAGRICSPTAVAMVLAYRGVTPSTLAVCERAFDPVNDIYGNWPNNVQAAHTFGVPGYLTRFGDWAEVERTIAGGQPLVVSIAAQEGELSGAPYPKTDGHLLVLCGFDEQGDCVVNDPAAPELDSVRRVYKRAELEKVWMGRGGVTYVLLPRS